MNTMLPRLAAVALFACVAMPEAPALTLSEQTRALARQEFRKSARRPCIPAQPCFKVRNTYPKTAAPETPAWRAIDFRREPERYLEAVLAYVVEGNVEADWVLSRNRKRGWYHAAWMHPMREPVRGLTFERGSRLHELSGQQTRRTNNWAIGFYNRTGATAFARVWRDRSEPATANFAFPEGTVSAKLLFTDATDEEAPYLKGNNLVWQADIRGNGDLVPLRLLQVDVAVKHQAGPTFNGWVFGTFHFDGRRGHAEYWRNLAPVGLEWGTSPAFTHADFTAGRRPEQGWVSPAAEALFATRAPDGKLGYLGRMNGPVDDPRSSCLACHGRAMDMRGDPEPPLFPPLAASRIRQVTVAPNTTYERDMSAGPVDEAEVARFFRNLAPGESWDGTHPTLDFSLQLMKGTELWQAWLQTQLARPQERALAVAAPARDGASRGD